MIICSTRKIGYNLNKYITFKSSWDYSIDLIFDINDMHATDLYMVIFSYLRNHSIYCLDLFTISINQEKTKIFSKKNAFQIKKMTYREFESWWEYRQWYDSNLLERNDNYGIRIVFIKELVDLKLNELNISLNEFYCSYKPAYPWSYSLIIEIFKEFLDETNEDEFWKISPIYRYYKKPIKK